MTTPHVSHPPFDIAHLSATAERLSHGDFLWHPEDHPWTRGSHVARLMRAQGFAAFEDLRAASLRDTTWFWDAAVRDLGLEWFQPYTQVRDNADGFPWTRWFLGGAINITHNCIDRHVRDGHGDDIALYYEPDSDDPADRRVRTFAELKAAIDDCAGSLRAFGIGPGDSVGLYAPMRIETVVVMFACFKLGARFVPVFCGYGEQALIDRLESCGAKLLFAVGHLHRRGKPHPAWTAAMAARHRVASLQRVVFFDEFDHASGLSAPPAEMAHHHLSWIRFLRGAPSVTECVRTAAEEPCLILYTSGTTGRPKGTVHTHAGCLAQMGKELRYAFDVQPGEPFFWFTDIGWMMGPWELIGCLLHRTPVVLFDGAPDHPTSDRLWQTLERLRVVTFAASPTLVRLLMRAQDGRGPRGYDLSRLRVLGSTGEPWDETSYRWFFENVGGERCPVMNISGGTEIVGCLLQPYPLLPLKACSLGGPALGMDVDVFTEEGRRAPAGVVGHLVCRQPAPSMTKSFLHDDARYLETYFEKFPGVWYHGDWALRDADEQWFLLGRSDDTIKVAGKRVGPAEVEGVLTAHPAVSEAAAIGVPDELKGQALVCFVVLKGGAGAPAPSLPDASGTPAPLEADLIAHVAAQLGKPLAPKAVHVVAALPKTRSGKVLRGTIRRVYLGEPPGDLASVDNPPALEAIAACRRAP